jgi:type I restriction enzyme, S subunit
MSKSLKKTFVPSLRFPAFREAGEWKEIRFIDTADKKTKWSFIGGPFGSNLKSSDYVANGVRIIQLQNIGDAEFFDDYKIFTTVVKADELLANNIYPSEIILSKMGDPVGRACLIPHKHSRYVMCSDGIRLVVDEKNYSKYFIYTLINSLQFRALVEKTATGSTRKRIGLDDLKNLPMVLPKKGEQQKIADCLSSIDALISAQSQKVEILKTHKKGLMQQLFPREGETIPRLRFPEFRDAEEWNGMTISDCAKVTTGDKDTQNKVEDGKYPFFVRSQNVERINSFSYDGEAILTSGDGVGVGKNFHYISGKFDFHQRVYCIYEFNKTVLGRFIFHLFSEYFDRRVMKLSAKNSVDSVRMSMITDMPIRVPRLKEQHKIADYLSSIDALISAQSQKVEALKVHKKGLMQALFPAVDEGKA